jgi:BTB And C-terminal Kelch
LENKTVQAFKSDTWLTVPASVVQEILKMDKLNATEKEVVVALLRWGNAQVTADGDDPATGGKLREKLDTSLNLIRYSQLTSKDFSDLCQGELGQVLTGEEKFQILNCIVQKKRTVDLDTSPLKISPN